MSSLETSLLRSTVSQFRWYARKEHSAFYDMVTQLKKSNISCDLSVSNSDTYWAPQMAFLWWFYNLLEFIVFGNLAQLCLLLQSFWWDKGGFFPWSTLLQYFHLQTTYHFRRFSEVTNWEAGDTLKQMLSKLVSRRIFILRDNNFIIVLQIKRLEYTSSPVCYGFWTCCNLEELLNIHNFQKLSEDRKCFPKPLHISHGLKSIFLFSFSSSSK